MPKEFGFGFLKNESLNLIFLCFLQGIFIHFPTFLFSFLQIMSFKGKHQNKKSV